MVRCLPIWAHKLEYRQLQNIFVAAFFLICTQFAHNFHTIFFTSAFAWKLKVTSKTSLGLIENKLTGNCNRRAYRWLGWEEHGWWLNEIRQRSDRQRVGLSSMEWRKHSCVGCRGWGWQWTEWNVRWWLNEVQPWSAMRWSESLLPQALADAENKPIMPCTLGRRLEWSVFLPCGLGDLCLWLYVEQTLLPG